MSQYLGSSSRIVKAMDIDASPRRVNSLANKVIHADFQVTSIEDVPQPGAETLSADNLQESSSTSTEDDPDKLRADNMRMWWNEAIARNMNLPEGYSQVSVLIIKWADELDELKTKSEVRQNDLDVS
jgi:hypothetical protein